MKKFDYQNRVERNHRISRLNGRFHTSVVVYNSKTRLVIDDIDGDRYWRRSASSGSLDHEILDAHWADQDINNRCHKVTGTRAE